MGLPGYLAGGDYPQRHARPSVLYHIRGDDMGKGPYKVQVNIDTSDWSCVGATHNYLTIIRPTHMVDGYRKITCRCVCGNEVDVIPFNWKCGRTKSCGCMAKSLLSDAFTVLEHTPDLDRLRRIYHGMKDRCFSDKNQNYKYYGGRGITVCQEWLDDREAFITWALENGYRNDLSIDRIDVNGNYEPGNCRWATDAEQRANQRPRTAPYKRHIMFTIDGVTRSAIEWCEEYGVTMPFVMYRIRKNGMSPLEALTVPKRIGRPCRA